jgi:GT2 family glycosyltransferase
LANVSIVILNFNGEKLLQQFLPSVVKYSGTATIIVADNGSTDNSIEVIKKEFPGVEIIRFDKNYGFCEGYNRALRLIQSEYSVLLNSDVEVTPGWLAPLLDLLEKDKTIAAVQPKILSYHQKTYFEYAGAGGGYIDAFGYPFCRGRVFNYTEKDSGQYDDTREVFWTSGACMVIRNSVYHALYGLDETFFAHMEEIDLCWKIQRSGLKLYYCGSSHVYHVGAGTLSRSNPKKTYYNFRNGLSLLYKHLPTGQLIYKLPLRILLDYAAAMKFLLGGGAKDFFAVLRAHYDFFRTLRNTHTNRKILLSKLSFSNKNVYPGLIPVQHYLLKKNVILVKSPK